MAEAEEVALSKMEAQEALLRTRLGYLATSVCVRGRSGSAFRHSKLVLRVIASAPGFPTLS